MNWKKLIAVGTALTAIGVSMPTPLVQKCAAFADELIEEAKNLEYGDLTYRVETKLVRVEGEDGTATYDEVKNVYVKGIKSSAKGDVVIPDEIDGVKVISLYFDAYKLSDVTSIRLPRYLENYYADTNPAGITLKVAEKTENFYIENGFLINNNGSSYDETNWISVKGKVVEAVAEPLSGEVSIPEGVVGCNCSLRGNADITKINLPASLECLPKYFCDNMPNLKEFSVAEGGTYFSYSGALGKNYYATKSEWVNGEGRMWKDKTQIVRKYILAVPEGYEGEFVVDDGVELTFSGICFENIPNLTSVVLGKDTVVQCDRFAGCTFAGCTSLEHIELNGDNINITGIDKDFIYDTDEETGRWYRTDEIESFNHVEAMFGDTKWYQEQPDGVLYLGTTIVGYKGTPDGDKIDIKEGTRTVIEKAFNGLNISEINVPASVEYMGYYSVDCPALTAINVDKDNPSYASVDGILFTKSLKTLLCYPQSKPDTSYTIPEETYIEHNAFAGCTFLKSVKNINSDINKWRLSNPATAFAGCHFDTLELPEDAESYYAIDDWLDYKKFYCDTLIIKNPDCMICTITDCDIVAPKGSNAEAFAQEHGFKFTALDDYEKQQAASQATTTTAAATTTAKQTTTTTAAPASTTAASSTTKAPSASSTTTAASTTAAPAETTKAVNDTDVTTKGLGDLDGDGIVDASDASSVLLEYAANSTGGKSELNDAQKKAADVNGDDLIDASDASSILAYYALVSTSKDEVPSMYEYMHSPKG